MAYFDVLNVSSPWCTTVANIYKNIFKVIPLVNELIRRPASIRYTVVLRQSVPDINHRILLEKLTNSGLPRHIVRWIGAFLLDRRQKVMIGSNCSRSGSPNGGVPHGTLSGPKCFLLYVNDLESNVPLYK